jgi:hypothetical protein
VASFSVVSWLLSRLSRRSRGCIGEAVLPHFGVDDLLLRRGLPECSRNARG